MPEETANPVDKDIFILEFLPVSSRDIKQKSAKRNHAHRGTGYYIHKPTKAELQRLQLSE